MHSPTQWEASRRSILLTLLAQAPALQTPTDPQPSASSSPAAAAGPSADPGPSTARPAASAELGAQEEGGQELVGGPADVVRFAHARPLLAAFGLVVLLQQELKGGAGSDWDLERTRTM